MALQFQVLTHTVTDQTGAVTFSLTTNSFNGPITTYGAALAGFDIAFTDDDHHVRRVVADISSVVPDPADNTKLSISGTLGLNDKNSDDNWSGSIDILAMADVAQS